MIQEDANPFRQCFRSPNINGVEGLRRRQKYAGQQLYQSTFGEVCADREACKPRRGHACERESSDMVESARSLSGKQRLKRSFVHVGEPGAERPLNVESGDYAFALAIAVSWRSFSG